jgi:hypothetical protein
MAESTFQRAFAGGELAPSLAARADQAKYQTGLRTCRNFLVMRHGGVANRPGFRFVGETKLNDTSTFLLRYVSETVNESILIEAGGAYLRFWKNGARIELSGVAAWSNATTYQIGDIVVSAAINYYCIASHINQVPPNASFWYPMPAAILELPQPFDNTGFNWVQTGNVITLTAINGNVKPWELIHVSEAHWIIRPVTTAPQIGPPTGVVGVAGAAGTLSYQYVVTSAAQETFEESTQSGIEQVNTMAEPTPEAPVVLTWTPPASGAVAEYYVYLDPYGNGTFGFIGTATGGTTFNDTGISPDFAVTPPEARVLFNSTDDYPRVASNYQQRRLFANTNNAPDAVYGSRIGFPSNFSVSAPLQDDDAITFKIAGHQHNPVRHMIGLKTLIVLTDAGEWSVGQPLQALTPGNLPADQETYVGVSPVRPVVVGNSILYVQARGSIIRDLRFDQEVEGLAGRDLTIFAAHLFDGRLVDRLDYQQTPHSIVWAVRSDGQLLGLTYLREQEIWGWHRHDTGAAGFFEDVCVVPEANEDVVYVLVRRTIGGVFKRYIERLERREIFDYTTDAFFVDSGLTYSGPAVTTISGLGHLEGEVVAVVCNGAVAFDGDGSAANVEDFRVTGGTIAAVLPASTVIHAGLPIQYAEIELLDLDVSGSAVRDKKKRVGNVSLLLDASARMFDVGPDVDRLYRVKLQPHELGLEGVPFTGQESINIESDWNDSGRLLIRHTQPLPLSILGVMPTVELGG